MSCVTPALEDHVEVSLSLNGGADRSASLPFRVYEDEPVLQGLSPVLGSLRGGTVIHIRGAHLDHDTAICRFAGHDCRGVARVGVINNVREPITGNCGRYYV